MRTVELIPGVKSSVLGFGCAPILGAVDAATAKKALSVALDEGVTHFDLARSYGYGDAEKFVGSFMRGRREQIVLATKFGIVATSQARLLRPLKPLVRLMKKLRGKQNDTNRAYKQSPGTVASTIGDRFHARVPIEPKRLQVSVETSLRALQTDYLDYIFVHEPQSRVADMDAMLTMVERLKSDGKIRGWGLAFMREHWATHAPTLSSFDVLQFNLSWRAADYETVKHERAVLSNLFFSPFRGAASQASRLEVLSRLGGDFPKSVILCSMFSPEHIRANARLF
ncbi:aldo/keto reductase [Oleiharenicola lentus]|uniref:aldo/keto reductase n=1 Tax=Oleiharenicola lentus TaxID=2508720 RepID=UPI003F6720E4